jgi:hypothetical protein
LITLQEARESVTKLIRAGTAPQEAIDRGPLCRHCTNLLRPVIGEELKEESDATNQR